MIVFLDTSAFAKRYLDEAGSEAVRHLFRGRRIRGASRLTFVETCAAIARAHREGVLTLARRDQILDRLPGDFAELDPVVEPARAVYDRTAELLRIHPLRAYDAIQLASCLELRERGTAVEFWAQDGALIRAGRAERLKVVVVA